MAPAGGKTKKKKARAAAAEEAAAAEAGRDAEEAAAAVARAEADESASDQEGSADEAGSAQDDSAESAESGDEEEEASGADSAEDDDQEGESDEDEEEEEEEEEDDDEDNEDNEDSGEEVEEENDDDAEDDEEEDEDDGEEGSGEERSGQDDDDDAEDSEDGQDDEGEEEASDEEDDEVATGDEEEASGDEEEASGDEEEASDDEEEASGDEEEEEDSLSGASQDDNAHASEAEEEESGSEEEEEDGDEDDGSQDEDDDEEEGEEELDSDNSATGDDEEQAGSASEDEKASAHSGEEDEDTSSGGEEEDQEDEVSGSDSGSGSEEEEDDEDEDDGSSQDEHVIEVGSAEEEDDEDDESGEESSGESGPEADEGEFSDIELGQAKSARSGSDSTVSESIEEDENVKVSPKGGLKQRKKALKKSGRDTDSLSSKRPKKGSKAKGSLLAKLSALRGMLDAKGLNSKSISNLRSQVFGSVSKDIEELKRWRQDLASTKGKGKKKSKKLKHGKFPPAVRRAMLRLTLLVVAVVVSFSMFFMSTNTLIKTKGNYVGSTKEFLFDERWVTPNLPVEDVMDLIHVHEHKIPNNTDVKIKRLPGLDPPQYMNLKPTELVQIRRPAVRKMRPEDTRAVRTFGCLRDGCRGLAIEDLLDRGWQMRFRAAQKGDTYKTINYRVTFLLTDTTQLNHMQKIRPDLFKNIYEDYEGKSYLTAFQGGDAIGGNKGQQLKVKETFVRKFGCKYNDLGISPMSYRLYLEDECADLEKLEARGVTWLLKPETGSQGQGITFHSEVNSVMNKVPQFFPCKVSEWKPTERYLVQEYLEKPLLLKKSKFDVRVYMLIASSNPFLVFYHEGYLRRALAEYEPMSKDRKVYLTNTHFQSMKKGFKLSDHIWPFSMMQDHLREHDKTGAHYVETMLNPYIKKVALLIFQSARKKFKKRKGTFHIFGIDFMIDANYHTWFIESNGYPGFTWSINFDSRQMVEEYFNLAQQVHENPQFYTLMRAGDRYGSFEMIFSEIEEERTKVVYNPCNEFKDNRAYSSPLRIANRRFAKFTGKTGSVAKFKSYTNGVPGLESFAGSKADSVKAQVDMFKELGCNSRTFKYMPPTYLLNDVEDCKTFFSLPDKGKWVLKPVNAQGGEGVTIYASMEDLRADFGECGKSRKGDVVVQKFIENRNLFSDKWYDMKVFYLVSTTKPYMVFYRQGYIRSAKIQSVGAPKTPKRTTTAAVSEDGEESQPADGDAAADGAAAPAAPKAEEPEEEIDDADLGLDELEEEQAQVQQQQQQQAVEQESEPAEADSTPDLPPIGGDFNDPDNLDEEGENGGMPGQPGDMSALEPHEQWVPDEINTGDTFILGDDLQTFEFFEDAQAKLNRVGSRYMSSVFDTYAKRVGELIFRAARHRMLKEQPNMTRVENSYQLISANFLLDDKFQIFLTGQRDIRPEDAFPNDDQLKIEKADFLHTLGGLVLEANDFPQAYARMRRGDSYGQWRMVFSEIEEKQRPLNVDMCEEWRRNVMMSRGSIYKNAWLHNYAEKRHAANKRELNKYIEKKWEGCKHRPTREMMATCIRNTISYRYKIYLAKENAPYQDGYVEMRIRDLYSKWEAAKKAGGGGGGGGGG